MDRKYRPKTFADVLGQDGTIRVLRTTLNDVEARVGPTIFFGPFGSGKTTLARIYARAILCSSRQPDGSPCNICPSCLSYFEDRHPGYSEIDGANLTKVEDFRRILESTAYHVAGSSYMVYLIDECHMMSKSAQSLFLKPLEEGIPGVVWIFCTTDYHKILSTIRSRCIDYGIRTIPPEGIAKRVVEVCQAEGIPYEEEAVLAVVHSKGHFRDVLKFVGQVKDVGGVVSSTLEEYLDIGVGDLYFETLIALKEDPSKAVQTVEQALSRLSASDVYNGLVTAALDAYKSSKGVRGSLVVRDRQIASKLYGKYGDSISQVASYLLDRGNRRIDYNYLISALLLLHSNLDGRQKEVVVEKIVTKEPTTIQMQAKEPTNHPIKTNGLSKAPPLTTMDEKARRVKLPAPISTQAKTPSTQADTSDHEILSEKEFSLLLQRGFVHGRG